MSRVAELKPCPLWMSFLFDILHLSKEITAVLGDCSLKAKNQYSYGPDNIPARTNTGKS